MAAKKKFTYKEAGVDRNLRASSKKALRALEETYGLNSYGKIVKLPYGNIFPIGKKYFDLCIEGVGTKVLLAQLADKYDTIGIDGVAMTVNDVIRSGAKPIAIADNIHAHISDPELVGALINGVVKGAVEAECIVPGGEIGDVAEIIKGLAEGKGFDLIVACVGELAAENIIYGNQLQPKDIVIGLRSSGIHSNGISLARKILFKQWGGRYDAFDVPEGFDREIVYEALEPTKIYVNSFLKTGEKVKVKGAVHITGDAYLKFDRLAEFSQGVGFEFSNFKPQPIFRLIQETAKDLNGTITDDEMFRTFNMGWGFAFIVDRNDADHAIEIARKHGAEAEQIGRVTETPREIRIEWHRRKFRLK